MKPKSWIALALAAILAIAAVGAGPGSFAAQNPQPSSQPAAPASIEPELQAALAAEGQADLFVVFREQADLSAAYDMSWDERGEYVYQALSQVAERTQANVRAGLDAQGIPYTSFPINNSIYIANAPAALANALLGYAEVSYLRLEHLQPLPEPIRADADEPAPNAIVAWGLTDTHATSVWGLGYKGAGIKVANIDTGVQYNHPALDQSFACPGQPNNAACWYDPGNYCGAGGACDNNGHGTHTMGTMVGDDDPSLVYNTGMAPDATWIACKGCGTSSCSDADLTACANWILSPGGSTANRPNVVNNSWGGGGGNNWYLTYVNAWRAAGIFPAFSAGNNGENGCNSLGSPGDYQESFATAAHNSSRTIASFSSRGPSAFGHSPYTKPNISAPGVNICSTVPGSGYDCTYSGTSMASPHTAGAVALIWGACPTYRGNINATFQLLQNTADTPPAGDCGAPGDGGNYTYGYGYLNVLDAVTTCTGGPGLYYAYLPIASKKYSSGCSSGVLWDQPLSAANTNAYVDQEFPDNTTYSSFLADDFTNSQVWHISKIFVPGNGWNGFSSLYNATALTWQIYADAGGVPAGNPVAGGATWSLTLAPTNGQVAISNGSGGLPSNVTLNLGSPITLPAGHWWLVFYPTMNFSPNGQYGRQPADTAHGYIAQFINPGGAFGYGTVWQDWGVLGPGEQDMAFRLEGSAGGGGFDSEFNNNADGWVSHTGTWWYNDQWLYTYYLANTSTSASHVDNFSDFDYSAAMWRYGCDTCANRLIFRGTPDPLQADNHWHSEYTFQFDRVGDYSLFKRVDGGSAVSIVPWTYTSALNQGDAWNTLRVVADGSSLALFINGIPVWSGYDASLSVGRAGVGMYSDGTASDAFYVDWARLSILGGGCAKGIAGWPALGIPPQPGQAGGSALGVPPRPEQAGGSAPAAWPALEDGTVVGGDYNQSFRVP